MRYRATPKTQSAVARSRMQETQRHGGRISQPTDGVFSLSWRLKNPVGKLEGTYPLPEAQLIRFLFKIPVFCGPFPTVAERWKRSWTRTTGGRDADGVEIVTRERVLEDEWRSPENSNRGQVRRYAIELVIADRNRIRRSPPGRGAPVCAIRQQPSGCPGIEFFAGEDQRGCWTIVINVADGGHSVGRGERACGTGSCLISRAKRNRPAGQIIEDLLAAIRCWFSLGVHSPVRRAWPVCSG